MLAALKTPQRSILKAESGNSIVKKRRVVFASDDEKGSDSSSSEMMEVEVRYYQIKLSCLKGYISYKSQFMYIHHVHVRVYILKMINMEDITK